MIILEHDLFLTNCNFSNVIILVVNFIVFISKDPILYQHECTHDLRLQKDKRKEAL